MCSSPTVIMNKFEHIWGSQGTMEWGPSWAYLVGEGGYKFNKLNMSEA